MKKVILLLGLGTLLFYVGFIVAIKNDIFSYIYDYLIAYSYLIQAASLMVVGGILVFLGFKIRNNPNREIPEPDEEAPKQIWKATIDNVDKEDFEETRRCLLNSYNANTQTHAGIIIALTIGLFTVISAFDAFTNKGFWQIQTFVFIGLIVGISIGVVIMFLRIVYWTIWVNVALTLTIDKAINYFNDTNETYSSKAPNTAIITQAICEQIKFEKNNVPNNMPYYKKLALKTNLR